jgi:hypothetical protein
MAAHPDHGGTSVGVAGLRYLSARGSGGSIRTFKEYATEFVKRREGEWKNPVHRKQGRDTLGIGGFGKSRGGPMLVRPKHCRVPLRDLQWPRNCLWRKLHVRRARSAATTW